jgi:hypothetical protein
MKNGADEKVASEHGTIVEVFDVELNTQHAVGMYDKSHSGISLIYNRKVVVFIAKRGGDVIGHSLVRPVEPGDGVWSVVEDATVKVALSNGTLMELGGLSVVSEARGHGVGRALLGAQLLWLSEHPKLLAVSKVESSSAELLHIANQIGVKLGETKDEALCFYKYDRERAILYMEHSDRVVT